MDFFLMFKTILHEIYSNSENSFQGFNIFFYPEVTTARDYIIFVHKNQICTICRVVRFSKLIFLRVEHKRLNVRHNKYNSRNSVVTLSCILYNLNGIIRH